MSFPEPTTWSCLAVRGSGQPTCSWSPRTTGPGGDCGAWLDAGPGEACKSLALLPTLTYIVIHGSYSSPVVGPLRTARVRATLDVRCSAPGSDAVQRHQQARR